MAFSRPIRADDALLSLRELVDLRSAAVDIGLPVMSDPKLPDIPVTGFTEPRFNPLREVFLQVASRENLAGSALSVWHAGREVVRLAAGWQDASGSVVWSDRTLTNVFSVGKPFAALAALYWVAQGAIELDRPVATYWPDYGSRGKEGTTLRHILAHRSGLASFPESSRRSTLTDTGELIAHLANAAPSSVPGAEIAEHALTYGHLIDGVLAGAGVDSVAGTLRTLADAENWDLWFGVSPERLDDVADLQSLEPTWADAYLSDPHGAPTPYLRIPESALELDVLNSESWRTGSFPAIGLHASAASLAEFYSTLASPTGPVARILGATLHREYLAVHSDGFDGFLNEPAQWTLGLKRDGATLGMAGIGGSVGWQVSDLDYSCGFVTRTLSGTDRAGELRLALESCLAAE